jgi:glutaryl-CoA dehydrogenase (non-decarboxylating)
MESPGVAAATRAFVDNFIMPEAGRWDREERLDNGVIHALARQRYLGAVVPHSLGGSEMGPDAFGSLCEELGRGCSSVRSLITVHSMVCDAIRRWGSESQRHSLLPRLASGEMLAAFALTEPDHGSDVAHVSTRALPVKGGFVLSGLKKWVSFGQIADLFLVIGTVNDEPAGFLVRRSDDGVRVKAIGGMLGMRASMPAEVDLKECVIPEDRLLGPMGWGLRAVAASSLDLGRFSVAWGCVGIAQACLEASLAHAVGRVQGGVPLAQHQLIQRKLTNIFAHVRSARLVCKHATELRSAGDETSVVETCLAKYIAARSCVAASAAAVQIHGAVGCNSDMPVERHFRDSKVMEIIEGTSEIHQILIGEHLTAMAKTR